MDIANLLNRTYILGMDGHLFQQAYSIWLYRDKPCRMIIDPSPKVEKMIRVIMRPENHESLDVVNEIAERTRCRIAVLDK